MEDGGQSLDEIMGILSEYKKMLTVQYSDILPKLFQLQDVLISNPGITSILTKNRRDKETIKSLNQWISGLKKEREDLLAQKADLLKQISSIM